MNGWSNVWDHFTRFLYSQGEKKARCNYCGKEFCADLRRHGTGSLNNHINVCKKKKNVKQACTDTRQAKIVFGYEIDGFVTA